MFTSVKFSFTGITDKIASEHFNWEPTANNVMLEGWGEISLLSSWVRATLLLMDEQKDEKKKYNHNIDMLCNIYVGWVLSANTALIYICGQMTHGLCIKLLTHLNWLDTTLDVHRQSQYQLL